MRKIIYILAAVMTMSSCSGFLDETNRNSITADLQYSTPEGYESLINTCYAYGRLWYGKTEGFALSDLGTDCFTAASGCSYKPLAFYSQDLQGSMRVLEFMWNGLYGALNACNAAIERADKAGLSADVKKKRLGEAHFLRAFYLWHITETWGDVCLYTNEIKSVVNTAHRTSVDDFYERIFLDLNKALELLEGTPAKDKGRVTEVVAKAFKARLCLARGDNKEAVKLAKEVIADPAFEMYDSFAETFDINNSEGSDNTEAIWWINYCENNTLNTHFTEGDYYVRLREGGNHGTMFSAMVYWTYPGIWVSPETNSPNVENLPTLAFLNMFDETIDQRYDVTFRTAWYVNDASKVGNSGLEVGDTAVVTTKYSVSDEERAKRKYKYLDKDDVYAEDGTPTGTREYFISMYKFQDPTRPTGWEKESKRDMFVMRISEMYLIVAEGAMKEGNMDEAVRYMNEVREKRAQQGEKDAMKITAADMDIDFVLDERAREFAGEHLRWFDLKRTGKLMERVKKYNPDGEKIKEFHLVRPIPQSQLDAILNKEEFKQNDQYI